MNASLKGRHTTCKITAADSLAVNSGDLRLRASMTDVKIVNGPSLNGLTFAAKKPGFYRYVPKKFMNTFRLAKNPVKLSYSRKRGDKRTVVDGALVFDSGSKVSATYMVGSKNCKLKYSYLFGGITTFEPCYDLGKNVWDFAISRIVYDNVFKATYQTWSKNLALEWLRKRVFNGTFKQEFGGSELFMSHDDGVTGKRFAWDKISASVNLAEGSKSPKFVAESSWDVEM